MHLHNRPGGVSRVSLYLYSHSMLLIFRIDRASLHQIVRYTRDVAYDSWYMGVVLGGGRVLRSQEKEIYTLCVLSDFNSNADRNWVAHMGY